MPDVTKPPLHTLPHAELLAKLDALTNVRVVRDSTSATAWKLEIGPFPAGRTCRRGDVTPRSPVLRCDKGSAIPADPAGPGRRASLGVTDGGDA